MKPRDFAGIRFGWRSPGAAATPTERGHWFAPVPNRPGHEFQIFDPVGETKVWLCRDIASAEDPTRLKNEVEVEKWLLDRLAHYAERDWRRRELAGH